MAKFKEKQATTHIYFEFLSKAYVIEIRYTRCE
jgi:hypothetical protein